MAENKLNYKKDESVYLPSDDGSYSIRKFDWNRIKRIVDNTGNEKDINFKVIYSILYGVGGSTGISIIPILFADNLPAWVIPLYIIGALFSIGIAVVLTLMDNKTKKNKELDINEIKTEMEELENLFPQQQTKKDSTQKQKAGFKIIKAIYFTIEKSVDVTKELAKQIKDNRLEIVASNDIAGDPHPGMVKVLEVNYELNGVIKTSNVKEGETLIIENQK